MSETTEIGMDYSMAFLLVPNYIVIHEIFNTINSIFGAVEGAYQSRYMEEMKRGQEAYKSRRLEEMKTEIK